MSNEWTDLKDLQAVADAQSEGWEIITRDGDGYWVPWRGRDWDVGNPYRGRPAQPKKTVIPCYFTGNGLTWSLASKSDWVHIPERDITVTIK
jgi:hypothetical protein